MGYLQKVRLDDSESIVKEYTAGTNITITPDGVISATGGGGQTYTAGDGIDITNNVITNIAKGVNYTAGDNIQISNTNVISATDTKYSAGDNITIDANNVISALVGSGTVWAAGRGTFGSNSSPDTEGTVSFPQINRNNIVAFAMTEASARNTPWNASYAVDVIRLGPHTADVPPVNVNSMTVKANSNSTYTFMYVVIKMS